MATLSIQKIDKGIFLFLPKLTFI